MHVNTVTTGLRPLTIGSDEIFQCQAWDNKLAWDLTGGSVTFLLADPNGNVMSIAGSIVGQGGQANWRVLAPAGTWYRAYKCVDVAGTTQISRPIQFEVESSPI